MAYRLLELDEVLGFETSLTPLCNLQKNRLLSRRPQRSVRFFSAPDIVSPESIACFFCKNSPLYP